VSDFLTDLRREVLDAHGRHQRQGRWHRRVRRLPRRAVPLAVAAVAAGLLIVVAIVSSLPQAPPASRLRIVAVLPAGRLPLDGALGGGSLWVADSGGGAVVRIDPAGRRVLARIPIGGDPQSIAAGAGAVWVRSADADGRTHVSRIDPETNRVVARFRAGGSSGLAVGSGAIWSINRYPSSPEDISRIDPSSHRVTAHVNFLRGDGVVADGDVVWAIDHTGTVARIDARSARVVRRWPQLAPSSAGANAENVLAADRDGVWALSASNAVIVRITGERLARRIAIDPDARPVLARAPDGLWIAAGGDLRTRNRLIRIDPKTGKTTATVDIGAHRPQALVPAGRTLCVVTADGTVLLIAAST
jgi:DNA-binding beta-propeller fold protein YncE